MSSSSWQFSGVKNLETPTDELNESEPFSSIFLMWFSQVRVIPVDGTGETGETLWFPLRMME